MFETALLIVSATSKAQEFLPSISNDTSDDLALDTTVINNLLTTGTNVTVDAGTSTSVTGNDTVKALGDEKINVRCFPTDPKWSHRRLVRTVKYLDCLAVISAIDRIPTASDTSKWGTSTGPKGDRIKVPYTFPSIDTCLIQVTPEGKDVQDEFSMLDIATVAQAIADECIKEVKAPQKPRGGTALVGPMGLMLVTAFNLNTGGSSVVSDPSDTS